MISMVLSESDPARCFSPPLDEETRHSGSRWIESEAICYLGHVQTGIRLPSALQRPHRRVPPPALLPKSISLERRSRISRQPAHRLSRAPPPEGGGEGNTAPATIERAARHVPPAGAPPSVDGSARRSPRPAKSEHRRRTGVYASRRAQTAAVGLFGVCGPLRQLRTSPACRRHCFPPHGALPGRMLFCVR